MSFGRGPRALLALAGRVLDSRVPHLAVILSALLSSACATVLGPKEHEIRVDSRPAGAKIWVNGYYDGTTPKVVRVPRGQPVRVVIALFGQKQDCAISRELSGGWLVADIVFGLLPLIVDAATGAWYEPSGSECFAHFLEPEGEQRARRRSDPPRSPKEAARASEDEAIELCNKGVERFCRQLLEKDDELPSGDGEEEPEPQPTDGEKEADPPKAKLAPPREVFRPAGQPTEPYDDADREP